MRASREVADITFRINAALEPLVARVLEERVSVERVAVRKLVVDQEQHDHKHYENNGPPRGYARLRRVRRAVDALFYQTLCFWEHFEAV